MAVEKVVVRNCAGGNMACAQIVRAGRWVFGTGLRATNELGLIDASVTKPGRPLGATPKAEREARKVFDVLGNGLAKAGSALDRVVRVDQYYPDWRAVDPYHVVRKQALGKVVAPSTSILVDGLLNLDADMDVQAIALTQDSGLAIEPVNPKGISAPGASGYAPCLRVGDFIFVAGQLARDETGDIAADAKLPQNQLWKGTRIKLETSYLIEKRLRPALEAAGSDLDLILKAQIYLSHPQDLPGFLQVWHDSFPGKSPPITVVPVRHPAFGTADARLEVNVIAASRDARARIRDIDCDVELLSEATLAARSLDELLFVSGLMAIDQEGLVSAARPEPTAPYTTDSPRAQAADILEKARVIFSSAGTDLSNVVRAIHFQSDLSHLPRFYGEWVHILPGVPVPFTSVGVNEDMFVPGASLILDLWGYLPGN